MLLPTPFHLSPPPSVNQCGDETQGFVHAHKALSHQVTPPASPAPL